MDENGRPTTSFSERRKKGRLPDEQYEAIVHAAAQEAADILEQRLQLIVKVGRGVARTILWIFGAISLAFGLWHHEPLAKLIFG